MSEAHIGDTAKVKSSNVDSCELNPSSECIGYIQGQHRASEVFGKHDENCNDTKERGGDSSRAPSEDIEKRETVDDERREAAATAADGDKKRGLIQSIHSVPTKRGTIHFG